MLDPPRPDGTILGMCSRCLKAIEGKSIEDLVEVQFYELRDDGQVWCLACSKDARRVKRFNSRGREVKRPGRRR